jgi:hypothetical protein
MYEVISGLPPYHNLSHNENLAMKICQRLRPRFIIKVPQLIVYLIKRCLDADPFNRPRAEEIEDVLYKWKVKKQRNYKYKLKKQDHEMNNNLSNSIMSIINLGLPYKTHLEAFYTSRLLDFNNLSEPKNSDDYYII